MYRWVGGEWPCAQRGLSGSKQVRYDLSCSRSGSAGIGSHCVGRTRRKGKAKQRNQPVSRITMILVAVAVSVVACRRGRSRLVPVHHKACEENHTEHNE
jgi:hypothetical protein